MTMTKVEKLAALIKATKSEDKKVSNNAKAGISFEIQKATFVENWPKELHEISIRTEILRLSWEETEAIANWFGGVFWDGKDLPLPDCSNKIKDWFEKTIPTFHNGCFFRLGSRSPKDSYYIHKHGAKITDTKTAMEIMFGESMRMFDDWLEALHFKYPMSICLREWYNIEPWSEFRCFLKNNELIGVSQYDYMKDTVYSDIINHADVIYDTIKRFVPVFIQRCHVKSVIFDVFLSYGYSEYTHTSVRDWSIKLLEINPFLDYMTNPCLYDWHDEKTFDIAFRYCKLGEKNDANIS